MITTERLISHQVAGELRSIAMQEKPIPDMDWDTIWVLSAPNVTFEEQSEKPNETRERIEAGIDLVKLVTAKRLGKDLKQTTVKDIHEHGPYIYFSGWNEHNTFLNNTISSGIFEDQYAFPRNNLIVGPQEDILHTQHQFEYFPQDMIEDSRKIVVVTHLYHMPRVKRYADSFSKRFSNNQFIFYPINPSGLSVRAALGEIRKIPEYEKRGIFEKK